MHEYKDAIILSVSESTYYQLLVFSTIASSYIATYISYCVYNGHVFIRRKISKSFNFEYITSKAKEIDTNSNLISEENKNKIQEILRHDLQKEFQINGLYSELQKMKTEKND